MDRPLVNYHAHTWRCQHATGTEEDYIRQAIASGFEVCGFSDHTPWPYKSSFVSGMRMRIDQLEGYIATVRRLSEEYAIGSGYRWAWSARPSRNTTAGCAT